MKNANNPNERMNERTGPKLRRVWSATGGRGVDAAAQRERSGKVGRQVLPGRHGLCWRGQGERLGRRRGAQGPGHGPDGGVIN